MGVKRGRGMVVTNQTGILVDIKILINQDGNLSNV